MNKEQAQKIIKETFEGPFEKGRFIVFIKNLLKNVNESKAVHFRGYTPHFFKDRIKTYERVGQFTDNNGKKLDILIVYLKKETSLDRARTIQRNFAADYLKKRGEKEIGLFAFVSPDFSDWRFSFVKMEYKLAKTKKGNLKATEEYTPAKRYSFLVGSHEKSHTAQSQLSSILTNLITPSIDEIENAFSIEKVTREFFEKYRGLFLQVQEKLDEILDNVSKVRNDFRDKKIKTDDFTKKLLGQIVFLYFLQKKGWFGVPMGKEWGEGDKKFLRTLFKKANLENKNYFNDYLEPLFYEALAKERDDDFYSRFSCKIPFLNGGLFDPINNYDWVNTEINLPNDLFSNQIKTKEGDIGTGILDIFDRYNFTVKEDEPLDKEVAVDPEMLGKVFENLLEVKDRKSKGTYYTPREIVHYMCRESLVNYLKNETKIEEDKIRELADFDFALTQERDKKERQKSVALWKGQARKIEKALDTIRVVDPACGSGAFLVGMMQEIIHFKRILNMLYPRKKKSLYDVKSYIIKNNLYGVDIDASAVEIAKLRLWLSLVVDEDDIKNIKPLPNLDYKIMQGNSLIELLSPGILAKTIDDERSKLIDELNQYKSDFFEASSKKQELKDKIDEKIREIVNYDQETKIQNIKNQLKHLKSQEKLFTLKGENLSLADVKSDKESELSKQLGEFEQVKQVNSGDHFEWHLHFNEVFEKKGGFDVSIANPPYVEHKKLASISKELKRFKVYSGRSDLYVYFYEVALNILKKEGILCFISSNKFTRTSYGKQLRELLGESDIKTIIDFTNVHVFEALVATLVIILQKNDPKGEITYLNSGDEMNIYSSLDAYISAKGVRVSSTTFGRESWILENPRKMKIKKKLDDVSIKIQDIPGISISRGITTGLNESFIINRTKKNELIKEDHQSADLIKPILQGRNIRQWFYKPSNAWIIVVRHGFHTQLSKYKAIYKYLLKYKIDLKRRGQCRINQHHWLELDNNPGTAYLSKFKKEKIIWGLTANTWAFAYDNQGYFLPSNGYILVSSRVPVKYLLALLNSSLLKFYFSFIGIMTAGGAYTLKHETVRNLPFKKTTKKEQKLFTDLVDKILAISKSSDYLENPKKQAQVKKYEKQIDQMVYNLYELTKEEIEIVEKYNEK